ncbi:NADPH2:quinone reductase [Strigomonas culicis]|uniref:NADPH2:quinone reductase n=1 Tax=Strigomonas culicis TaxID=28005 RepID=S9UZY5_9TRYP|nr:NADPH2:quinone reductase [Strigomonas culicis]EPY30297.1 oxidoreductase [Strigomonas culicis]EPY34329.1 NADPH2:quinone reductase [Strigomonas culicis]|eukprot:EPY19863.1 NADPH2:quinone reductase [Strigomonas culicis]
MSQKIASSGWRYARSGPIATVLRQEAFDVVPAKGEAVVRMVAAPLHRTDAAVINGTALGRKRVDAAAFPRVGGCEGVGQVVATGGAAHLKEGDTVWVAPLQGTWATTIAADPQRLHRIDAKHAGLAVHASTFLMAQQLLQGYARLRKGQVVLQNGGSSATALAVSALAQPQQLRVLTVAAPGPRFEAAKARHAAYQSPVFTYDGKGAREVAAAMGKEGRAALYLNGVGGDYFDHFLKLMAPTAHVVSYGAQNGFGLFVSGSNLIYNELTLEGFFLPTYLRSLTHGQRQTQLDFVLQQLADAKFTYPTTTAAGLGKLPDVWDDVFVKGGSKGIVKIQ